MSNVYVVTLTNRFGSDEVLDVFFSEEDARKAYPGEWEKYNHEGTILSQRVKDRFTYCEIHLHKKSLKIKDPLKQFALAVLAGDPIACDAVRDVLKNGG